MHLPRFLRQVNRVFTNPLLGTMAWLVPPLALVYHVGRKSGRRYQTPVVAFCSRRHVVIPMTYGRDVDWARNLLSARGGELVQIGRHVRFRRPCIVGGDAAYALLPPGIRTALRAADLPGYVLADVESPNARRRSAARR
jgi:deazaflavin-dependent oxidoreductase (nitroreductase family)